MTHMSNAGAVQQVTWVDDGSVSVTYSSPEEAKFAVQQMQQTTIGGNSRYIDVIVMDPKEFLAGLNIDADKAALFQRLAPEHQQQVMAKGTLSTARDPTAVLVLRIRKVEQGKGGPKGNGTFSGVGGKG